MLRAQIPSMDLETVAALEICSMVFRNYLVLQAYLLTNNIYTHTQKITYICVNSAKKKTLFEKEVI